MSSPYFYLLLISCFFMLTQAMQRNKETKHFLFAIFCASMAMMSLQNISASVIGPYQYLIGLGACATCNMVWLISRALFRGKNAIKAEHIVLAASIGILVMLNKTNALLNGLSVNTLMLGQMQGAVSEILNLLSSSVLVLSIWEAFRGFSEKNRSEQLQRIIFASAFLFGLFANMVLPSMLSSAVVPSDLTAYLVCISATGIIGSIQLVLILQKTAFEIKVEMIAAENDSTVNDQSAKLQKSPKLANSNSEHKIDDSELAKPLRALMQKEQIYLKADIKLVDIAQRLQVPEYKVSRTIRHCFKATNFNSFINQYRVEHAITLMQDASSQNWSLLVISLESGFSSLATFNRVFKATVGEQPSTYKKRFDNPTHPLIPSL
jgi:AraC-like DNA-binding protein